MQVEVDDAKSIEVIQGKRTSTGVEVEGKVVWKEGDRLYGGNTLHYQLRDNRKKLEKGKKSKERR